MTIPGFIYLAMGALLARILLDNTQTHAYRPIDWFKLAFDILRITMLWPLVLFTEKATEWLHREPKVEVPVIVLETTSAFQENWPFENPVPIPATGVSE